MCIRDSYEALRDETNFLSAISPNVSSSGQLIAGNNNYPSSVSGVGLEYLDIRQPVSYTHLIAH